VSCTAAADREHAAQVRRGGRHPVDAQLVEGRDQPPPGGVTVRAAGEDLAEHRVVLGRDGVAALDAHVAAHPRALRWHERGHPAGGGPERLPRVLRGDPRLDRVAVEAHVVLGEPQLLPARDGELCRDQVEPGDHLGHAVLDLQPGVHLQEEVLTGRRQHEELDGARAEVADLAGQAGGVVAQPVAHTGRQVGCRRLLDQLLVAPLHGAVAVAEVYDVAVRVRQHLHLDVPRPLEVALQVHLGPAERGAGLAGRGGQRGVETGGVVHDAHAAPAAAERGLDHDRPADPFGQGPRLRRVGDRARAAGGHRHAARPSDVPGRHLVAHAGDDLRGRSDEHQPRVGDRMGESGVLGEHPVSGVDGVGPGLLGRGHDRGGGQVGLAGGRGPDPVRLVGHPDVQCLGVGVAVDGDGTQAELAAGPDDPDRDLAAVGHENRPDVHGPPIHLLHGALRSPGAAATRCLPIDRLVV
jgi:hypothetical protein